MSTIETKIVKIEILEHPNAQKLSVVRIGGEGGFESVVGLGQFATGDLVIYIEPGSVVPENIQEQLAKNKITVKDGRIRAINIRNVLSEGLCLDPKEWLDYDVKEGDDVTKELGVTKYEPPPPSMNSALRSGKGINFNYINENFKTYNCVEKFKKCPKVLSDLGKDVVVTIKYHGMNSRYALVKKPEYKKSWWQKFIGLFIKENPQEFLVGSHNKIKVPSQSALKYGNYYSTDAWWRMARKYNLESVVKRISDHEYEIDQRSTNLTRDLPDVVVYAEIIGLGVQKGYCYGIPDGDLEIRAADIIETLASINPVVFHLAKTKFQDKGRSTCEADVLFDVLATL
ncbi:hypothetical protein LCGC14_2044220, partial [marine sediment metagenome]